MIAVLALSGAVVWLERADERPPSRIGVDDESLLALLAGFELPLLGLAATFALSGSGRAALRPPPGARRARGRARSSGARARAS